MLRVRRGLRRGRVRPAETRVRRTIRPAAAATAEDVPDGISTGERYLRRRLLPHDSRRSTAVTSRARGSRAVRRRRGTAGPEAGGRQPVVRRAHTGLVARLDGQLLQPVHPAFGPASRRTAVRQQRSATTGHLPVDEDGPFYFR